ncbi:MAG: pseudaminic acid biosynthesis-associated methylase [Rhodanobacter sp.]
MNYKTEQEAFWAGEFGSDYIARNSSSALLASNLAFFAKALDKARQLSTCIEFGANTGMNIRALQSLYPKQSQHALEINANATSHLRKILPAENVFQTSILDFEPKQTWDLALIKGVLIHINPDWLPQVYDTLYRSSSKYILLGEYYNPSPVTINYRGNDNRLFKRDFCGEMIDRYKDLVLVDYGFAYRRDPNFPQDDITWFLMEKRGHS